jgi:hypothetical membrane protein
MPEQKARQGASPIESLAIAAALVSGTLGFIVALIVQRGQLAPLASIATVALLVIAVSGAAAFIWAYVRHADGGVRWRMRHPLRRVLDVLGLTLTGVGVAVLLTASMFEVFRQAFIGVELNAVAAAALVAGLAGVCAYVLALIAGQLTTSTLATLLGLFLVAGIFTSMLTAEDPKWWHRNFSALGMGAATSSYAFNVTIVVAGLVILTLSDYLTIDLLARRGPGGRNLRGVTVIRVMLAIVGVALAGLGLVPVDISVPLHNTFSVSALLGFSALIVLTPVLLKGLSPAFLTATVIFATLIVVGGVLFAFGAFNLTALELIAVLVIFTWLILFTRNASSGRNAQKATEVEATPRTHTRAALTVGAVLLAFATGLVAARRR